MWVLLPKRQEISRTTDINECSLVVHSRAVPEVVMSQYGLQNGGFTLPIPGSPAPITDGKLPAIVSYMVALQEDAIMP